MQVVEDVAEKSVIVAVQEGPHAPHAIRWAAALARLEGRPLVLADAGPDTSAQGRLRAAVALAADVESTGLTIADSLSSAVALAALASPRALLVVGVHPPSAFHLGPRRSLSRSIAKRARCPVVAVHPPRAAPAHRGVVVGVHGDVAPDASLRFAYEHASWTRSPLTVLHCFWDVSHPPGLITDVSTAPNEHRQLAEAVAGLGEDYPDVPVDLRLAHGFAERLIVQAGRRADLVVVGSHHHGRLRDVLEGSVEDWVLTHAACDVAIVPERPDSAPPG